MSKKQDRIKAALDAGDALFAERKYEQAAAEYEKALRLHRESSCEDNVCFRVYVGYAACLVCKKPVDKNECAEAARLFEEALTFATADAFGRRRSEADAYCYWGDALYWLGEYPGAAAKYAEATSRHPSYAEAYKGWGNALYYSEHPEQAEAKYKEAVRHRRDYSEAIFNWGVVLQNLGKHDQAAAKYERVTELGTNEAAPAYNNWGRVLAYLGDDEGAAQKFGEAARLGASSADAHVFYNNLGDVLFRLGRYGEAVENLKEAQRCKPDYYYAFHNEAFVYWQEGRYRDARRVAAKAAALYKSASGGEKDEKNGEFFLSYAELLYKVLGRLEEAETAYRTALDCNPEDVDAAVGLVSLYAEMREEMTDLDMKAAVYWKAAALTQSTRRRLEAILKKKEKAAAARATTDRPAPGGAASDLYKLGRLLLAAREHEEAEVHLRKAVAADPTRAEPYADLGVLCARREDYKRAVGYFESSLERERDNLNVRNNLAEAYRQLKQIDSAEREYKRVLGVTACHVESYIGLGEVYVEMGDDGNADMYEEAISNFNRGLAVSKLECASRKLRDKEAAAVYYARGYARVGLYESLKRNRDEEQLRKASEDFTAARARDRSLHKARRAQERVKSGLKAPAGQRLTKTLGPLLIFTAAFVVFLLAQGSFFLGWPRLDPEHGLGATNYTVASFGALMFMLAVLSLPQLLKFKVAGVELEKSSIDQVSITEYKLGKPE